VVLEVKTVRNITGLPQKINLKIELLDSFFWLLNQMDDLAEICSSH
jgi:hypothetical protein